MPPSRHNPSPDDPNHRGASPYRAAALTLPSRPARPRVVLGGGCGVALAALCVGRMLLPQAKPPTSASVEAPTS